MIEINEEDIKKYYDFLEHKRETELRAVKYFKTNGKWKSDIAETKHVQDFSGFLSFCKKWNGKANLYAGLNERILSGTKAEDVISVRMIPLDIDSVHPKYEASTMEELEKSEIVTNQIYKDLVDNGFKPPMKIMTGNGFQLLLTIPTIEITDANRDIIENKIQLYINEIQNKYSDSVNCTIDQIGDLPRILKIPGTMSVKGTNTKQRPHRLSRIIEFNDGSDDQLKKYVLNLKVSTIKQIKVIKPPDHTRSGIEFAEVCDLILKKWSKQKIFERMMNFSKWSESPDAYRERTYEKALEKVIPILNEKEVEKPPDISRFFADPENLSGFIPKKLGDFIKEKHHFKTPIDTEEIYVYEDGIYVPKGNVLIKSEVRRILGVKTKCYHVKETLASIKETTYIDRDKINTNDSKIVLKNNILDTNTMETEDFSPDYFFTFKMPIVYDPSASCPFFEEWLDGRLRDDNEEYLWKIDVIQEFFGYSFMKSSKFERAMILYGEKRTGKSTLLNVLTKMIGKENTSSMSLQQITEDKFAMAYIHDKMVNIYADLTPKALKDVGKFLMIVSGDQMSAAKKYGHSFVFEPFTKLIFSCNTMPSTSNKGDEFYRRWLLLEFNNNIPEEEVDPNIKQILLEEMSGIFNWSLVGLKRLLKNNSFSYPLTVTDNRDMYEKSSDSVSSFIYNAIDEDDLNKIKKRDVYKCYKEYCRREKIKCAHQISFGKIFRNETGCGTSTINNIPAYVGIALKDEWMGWLGFEPTDEQKNLSSSI